MANKSEFKITLALPGGKPAKEWQGTGEALKQDLEALVRTPELLAPGEKYTVERIK